MHSHCTTHFFDHAPIVSINNRHIIAHGNPLIQDDSWQFQVSEPLDYPNQKYVSGGVRISEVLLYLDKNIQILNIKKVKKL